MTFQLFYKNLKFLCLDPTPQNGRTGTLASRDLFKKKAFVAPASGSVACVQATAVAKGPATGLCYAIWAKE